MSALAAVGALASEAAKRFSSSSNLSSLANEGKNVGILAVEVYTPSTYISQSDLEDHSGIAKGKYTLGLGQEGLGFCGDAEDVNSLALTVVHSLLEK
jgi:hydroxymethylglutaryl-CoA synthase